MAGDSELILRMIDDDEYVQMVGGSADDVIEVLLNAPRPGETMVVDGDSFYGLVAVVAALSRLGDHERALIHRLYRDHNEEMEGFYGYIIRSAVVIAIEPVLLSVTSAEVREGCERRLSWQRPDSAAVVDRHMEEVERLLVFFAETARRVRSLHLVYQSFMDPSRYPHRARQRLSRQAKQARRAAQGRPARYVEAPAQATQGSSAPLSIAERASALSGLPPPTAPTASTSPPVAVGRRFNVSSVPDRAGGKVRGTVHDATTGRPLSRVELALARGDDSPWTTSTDASGRFDFGRLAPGPYAFSAYYEGGELADGRAVMVVAEHATVIDAAFEV